MAIGYGIALTLGDIVMSLVNKRIKKRKTTKTQKKDQTETSSILTKDVNINFILNSSKNKPKSSRKNIAFGFKNH